MTPTHPSDRRAAAVGVAYAAAAYGSWGLLPVYFHALEVVPPTQILAHRVVWSVVFLVGVVTARRGWAALSPARIRALLPGFAASSLFLSANWLLYIWAVGTGQVLEASLGYFVTPLVNVLLGVLVLGERLTRAQTAAVALAAAGVVAQVVGAGQLPWIALALAGSFGTYGLLRKWLTFEGVPALFVEALLMLPFALGWIGWSAARGELAFARGDGWTDALLVGTGVVTAIPLLCFAEGARRLRLATMGLVQYLSPTGQLLLAVFAFGESFRATHAVSFAFIWAGLALYSADALRARYVAAPAR